MVRIGAITSCWTCCLSLLAIGWTIVRNWFPIEHGVYVGGTIGCPGIGYTFPNT